VLPCFSLNIAPGTGHALEARLGRVRLCLPPLLSLGGPTDNTYDHPRGPLVRDFMNDLKRARTELRRAAYEDRAIKNLKDGYNFDESL
jgi:hypothetical protein